MRSLKRSLCFSLMIATAILINYPTTTRGQTREAKLKATGSISGHVKSFTIGNIAPGRYWIIARPVEESESGAIKSIRQDSTLRVKVMREAEALKKEIPFKPCERTTDYDLAYSRALAAKQ